MTIPIEFVGGPSDGTREDVPGDPWLWDVMATIVVKRRGEPCGTYVRTRKLTRQGRLIYQWRAPAPQEFPDPHAGQTC